jgi:hypothetical protein
MTVASIALPPRLPVTPSIMPHIFLPVNRPQFLMWREIVLWLVLSFGAALGKEKTPLDTCGLYLAPSLLPHGPQNSIIAGNSFISGDVMDTSPSLLVRTKPFLPTQLFDYLYEADEIGYSSVLFGNLVQANDDQSDGNVEFDWENDSMTKSMKDTLVISNISVGDEIVTGFGRQRRYNCTTETLSSCRRSGYSRSDLLEKGHCLSHLYLNQSTFPGAGLGVYSKIAYRPGDVVHISPVIILPKHTILKASNASNSTVLNYCLSNNRSDVAILPLGLGAMINHPMSPSLPNVEVSWHSWSGSLPEMLQEGYPLNLTEIELATSPLFNIQYKALRDIPMGEEILLSYGRDWEEEWKSHQTSCSSSITSPQSPFLMAIQTTIFPSSFDSICIGRNVVECNIIRNERRIAGNETLQKLQQEGKLLSERLRSRVLSNEINSRQRMKFNGERYERPEGGEVCQRKVERL